MNSSTTDPQLHWLQGGTSPRPALRYGLVVVAGLVAGAVCLWTRWDPNKDHQVAFLITASTVAGTLLAVTAWLLVTAPWSWAGRLKGIAGIAVAIGLMMALVRIDETSGDVVPSLAWRWTPKHDATLAGTLGDEGHMAVDLAATTPADYAEFLGPKRDGIVPGPLLARDWSSDPPRELWRRPIGAGWSSFAIVGNHAVTQEQRGDEELIVCYELATGTPVWHHGDKSRFDETLAGVGPRSTPTIVECRVYALGALGQLNCLDGATGTVIWSHDIAAENGADTPELKPQWGKSCSPLVIGDAVVVSAGGPDGKSLVAYHRGTGDLLWHAGDDPASYSSPQLVTLAGQQQIVIINRESVVGHDPIDGRILWRYKWPGPYPKCTQPLVTGSDTLLVSAGYGLGSALLKLTPETDGSCDAEQLWPDKNLRNLKSKFADMILRGDVVYALDDGVLCCIEASTGKRRWRGGRYGHGQLLLVGDLLLVQAENGELALVDPRPERFIELGKIAALPGKTWNNPAISGNRLLVRNHEEAACYELPVRPEATAGTP